MWLHQECGYTYNGDNAIAGLTYPEIMMLKLGHLVRQEQQKQAHEGNGSRLTEADRQDYIDEYQERNNLGPYAPSASA